MILNQTVFRSDPIAAIDRTREGQTIRLVGWVDAYRDHGGLIFFHLRDVSGKIQAVADPEQLPTEAFQLAEQVRNEWVLSIEGVLRLRPEGTDRTSLDKNDIELLITQIECLARSETLPFRPDDADGINEEMRLRYRYIDLRGEGMRDRLRLRSRFFFGLREFLATQDFCEVETPVLGKSTPEGARDYLVPSRVHRRCYYALPQSPQLFKQLLMVGGLERYFQFARCFRDEDLRANRQPEFTQLDMEMSFVGEEDVFRLTEAMLTHALGKVGIELKTPFRRLTFDEAITGYGSDKPDISLGMKIVDLSDILRETEFKVFRGLLDTGGSVMAICVPERHKLSKKQIELVRHFAEDAGASAPAWGHIREGKFVSQLAKYFSESEQEAMAQRLFEQEGDGALVLFQADSDTPTVLRNLGEIRLIVADILGLRAPDRPLDFTWIHKFPLLEFDSMRNRYVAVHHPFTAPDNPDLLATDDAAQLLSLKARSYDLVCNGEEVGGGSIRIHDPKIQHRMFQILGLPEQETAKKFGFFIEALRYGTPPHGGIAFGLDRLTAQIAGVESIREVIAFPKTQSAACPLTGAPTPVTGRRDLGIF